MASYQYLTDNGLSLTSIWQWARRLIQELNKRDAAMQGMSVPVGARMMWATDTAPQGWMICNGGALQKDAYPELFVSIGYSYGGSGDVFLLPDLRNKILMGAGLLVGLNESAGSDTATLTVDNLPSHTHTAGGNLIQSLDDIDGAGLLAGSFPTSGGVPITTLTGSTGGDVPISILPPVYGQNVIIKV